MSTLEEQEATGSLMRMVNDAHYKLSLALFKFHAIVSYMDVIPEERFVEVETAIKGSRRDATARTRYYEYLRQGGSRGCTGRL